jgi:hypothetical protein
VTHLKIPTEYLRARIPLTPPVATFSVHRMIDLISSYKKKKRIIAANACGLDPDDA